MQISQDHDRSAAAAQVDIASIKAEMGHRTQNLLAMINSMVRMTARHETDVKTAMSKLGERINALSNAQTLIHQMDGAGSVGLSDVIERALKPYGSAHPTQIDAGGVKLTAHQITPISLILHELAANALAYGAFADPGGRLELVARQTDGSLEIDWRETCAPRPGPDGGTGFGTRLIERAALQLGGSCTRDLTPTGMWVRLQIKL